MNRVDSGLYGLGAFCLVLAVAFALSGNLDPAFLFFGGAALIGILYALDLIQYLRTKRNRTTITRRIER